MYDSLECQNNVQSGVRVPPTEVSGCLPLACHGDPYDPAVVAAEEVEFRCSWSDRQRRETPPDRWKDLTMLSPTQIHLPMTEIFPPFSLDYILWSASDLFPVLFCPDPGLSPLTWAACLANQICPPDKASHRHQWGESLISGCPGWTLTVPCSKQGPSMGQGPSDTCWDHCCPMSCVLFVRPFVCLCVCMRVLVCMCIPYVYVCVFVNVCSFLSVCVCMYLCMYGFVLSSPLFVFQFFLVFFFLLGTSWDFLHF